MTKNLAYSLLMVFGSSVLGACQMFDAVKGHPDSKSDVNQNTVQIYCSGAESCQFGRLDDLIVVNEKTQRIINVSDVEFTDDGEVVDNSENIEEVISGGNPDGRNEEENN